MAARHTQRLQVVIVCFQPIAAVSSICPLTPNKTMILADNNEVREEHAWKHGRENCVSVDFLNVVR